MTFRSNNVKCSKYSRINFNGTIHESQSLDLFQLWTPLSTLAYKLNSQNICEITNTIESILYRPCQCIWWWINSGCNRSRGSMPREDRSSSKSVYLSMEEDVAETIWSWLLHTTKAGEIIVKSKSLMWQ